MQLKFRVYIQQHYVPHKQKMFALFQASDFILCEVFLFFIFYFSALPSFILYSSKCVQSRVDRFMLFEPVRYYVILMLHWIGITFVILGWRFLLLLLLLCASTKLSRTYVVVLYLLTFTLSTYIYTVCVCYLILYI